jgi:small subunit ribosomal protein S20
MTEVKGMPNIKSAIKRVRVSEKKNAENKMKKSELRTVIKKVKASVASSEEKAVALKNAQKAIDQATAKNLMHKKTADRKKSRIAKAANAEAKAAE